MSPVEGRLDPERLRAALSGGVIGHRILLFAETRSTNDLVWPMAETEAREGVVVFAERQTAGRGQQGRRWESAPGLGLWFSVLLRPQLALGDATQLTGMAAAAVAATTREQTGVAASIKPPNDVYLGERKVAGVLVEGRRGADGAYVAVLGIGLNVNHALTDFPPELHPRAGSLAMTAGRPFDRTSVAISLLRELDARYRSLS